MMSINSIAGVLRAAGFRDVKGSRSVENDTEPGRGLVQVTIGVMRVGSSSWPRVEVVEYLPHPDAAMSGSAWAAKVFPTTYGPRYFEWLVGYWKSGRHCNGCHGGPPKRPAGFTMKKVLSFRACNAIIWSYNADLDPRLTARVKGIAARLRANC